MVIAVGHAQTLEGLHAHQRVVGVVGAVLCQTLLDQAHADRTPVGLEVDFARGPLAERQVVVGTQLIDVDVFDALAVAQLVLHVVEDRQRAVVGAGVRLRLAADVGRARQCGLAVVEGRCDLILGAAVDLAGQVLVDAADEDVALLVGQPGVLECVAEGIGDTREARQAVVARAGTGGKVAVELLDHGYDLPDALVAMHAEELDLVMVAEAGIAHGARAVVLWGLDQFIQRNHESREVVRGEIGEAAELAEGEQVDALDAVVIDQGTLDTRAAGPQGKLHLVARPRQRLDAPLLSQTAVELHRRIHTVGDHNGVQRPAQAVQPLVGRMQHPDVDDTLRELDAAVDKVAADDP